MDDRGRCQLCLTPLPADRRWPILRWLNPLPPLCLPATEECYRKFAKRCGVEKSDEEIRADVERARPYPWWSKEGRRRRR